MRRIEGLTGAGALAYLNDYHRLAREAAAAMKAAPAELPERITQLMDERRKLERELSEARRQLAMGGGGSGPANEAVDVGGVKVMARIVEGVEPKDLRALVDQAKQQMTSGVVALATASEGKAAIAVGVSEDLLKRFNAVELLRKGVEAVGGKGGGGRPDMAQGGGPDGSKLQAALDAITCCDQGRGVKDGPIARWRRWFYIVVEAGGSSARRALLRRFHGRASSFCNVLAVILESVPSIQRPMRRRSSSSTSCRWRCSRSSTRRGCGRRSKFRRSASADRFAGG